MADETEPLPGETVNLQYTRKMLNYGSSTLWKLKNQPNAGFPCLGHSRVFGGLARFLGPVDDDGSQLRR